MTNRKLINDTVLMREGIPINVEMWGRMMADTDKMETMKADLHMHGAIGFQPYWLKVQGYTRRGIPLLQLIADRCFEKGLDVCAVTSEEFEIPKGSVHDRLGYLSQERKLLPEGYNSGMLGENILIVEKDKRKIFLVNGQTAIINDDGRRYDHLVVGSNQVPQKDFDGTINYCYDNRLPNFLEHLALETHFGVGIAKARQLIDEYGQKITGVEGHNSQLIFHPIFSRFPVIKGYTKQKNESAQDFAERNMLPWIADSDAHRIKDAGISYIEFEKNKLDTSNELGFFNSLWSIVQSGSFTIERNYVSLYGWLDWTLKFKRGLLGNKYKKD